MFAIVIIRTGVVLMNRITAIRIRMMLRRIVMLTMSRSSLATVAYDVAFIVIPYIPCRRLRSLYVLFVCVCVVVMAPRLIILSIICTSDITVCCC